MSTTSEHGSVTCEHDVLPKNLRLDVDTQLCCRDDCADGKRHVAADAGHEILLAIIAGDEPVVACGPISDPVTLQFNELITST